MGDNKLETSEESNWKTHKEYNDIISRGRNGILRKKSWDEKKTGINHGEKIMGKMKKIWISRPQETRMYRKVNNAMKKKRKTQKASEKLPIQK